MTLPRVVGDARLRSDGRSGSNETGMDAAREPPARFERKGTPFRSRSMRLACALTLLLAIPMARAAAPPTLEPGVPHALAEWRARHYRDVRYELEFRLAPGAARIPGALALSVTLPARPVDLVLDWRGAGPADVEVNGAAARAETRGEHLVIARHLLKAGRNRVRLRFEAPVAASGTPLLRYRDGEDAAEYLYTLLVPADASALFPCFDQPDLKARFRLALELPAGWRAVSNAPVEAETPARVRFAETAPISSYLFAFAAGPFETVAEPGEAVRLFVRRARAARAREHAPELLRLNRAALDWFAGYFARPFPFPKYDLVLLPEFPYGGMEHAGATFLNEERVLFPAPPSAVDLLRRAQLLLHEASHQWFGNLVTMRWFDDLWLKEGFANFMAAKALEALAPEFDAWTAFHALKTAAVRTDATRGTSAIRYPLANLAQAKSAYGAIVYAKGPAVLRQAEFYLGAPVFRRAVRDFLRRHAFGAADWKDLVRAFERASGRRLGRWAHAWVERRGAPTVRARWTFDRAGRIGELRLEQHDALGDGNLWPQRLRVAAIGADSLASADVMLARASVRVRALEGFAAPRLVLPNAGDFGYGRFLLDPHSVAAALDPEFEPADPLARAQIAEALWEAARDADLAPARFIEWAVREIPRTADGIVLAGLLARLEVAFRRYLSDAQRDALAPRIERALLAEGALAAQSQSRRLALLRAFAAAAWSPDALADLGRLLDGALTVPGVPLAAQDRFRLVQRLLERGAADASARLAAEAARERTDEARRYAFAAGAAAADAGAKRALFRALLDDPSLPEAWIEAALPALNAPEHAALTLPLLSEALARLPALKRTRKIFFVNAWLAAFIGGQTGDEALEAVRAFLRDSRLEPDLRLKVLEAADGLERAVRIRARYAGGPALRRRPARRRVNPPSPRRPGSPAPTSAPRRG
jgi:aminopeptidase N